MDGIGRRLQEARLEAKLSQKKLGKAVGLTQSAISEIEAGRTKETPKGHELATTLNVNPEWLLKGKGEKRLGIFPKREASEISGAALANNNSHSDRGGERALDFSAMPRDMPVEGTGACGRYGAVALSGQTLDYIRRPPRLAGVKGAYALYVSGESMAPWREDGDPVYVHPAAPVKINDYVVVQLNPESDGEQPAVLIKRLVRRTATELHLRQFNPRKDLKLAMSKVGAIHKIIDWPELLGV